MTQKSKSGQRKKLGCVSLFSGAGGMDYGFHAAGFQTLAALEMDTDCCATLEANLPLKPICAPIEEVSSNALMRDAGIKQGELALLIGGPPCQPFSKSAYWASGDTKRLSDPRARTLHEYMRCVRDLLPEVFVLENVHGISYSGKEEGFQLLLELTDKVNRSHGTKYRLRWKVINAAEYGVPQLRERFFLVGHRDGGQFEFPAPSHAVPESQTPAQGALFALPPASTAWDAIGGLKPDPGEALAPKGQWADLLASIPEGENYLWHTDRKGGLPLFGWRTRYWSFLLKLAKNRPSWTIQAQPGPAIGPFHWDNRYLSVKEMSALQTFPEGTTFVGSRGSVQKQVGNAVPSLLAEVLGRAITAQVWGRVQPQQPSLAVPVRRPIPPASTPAPVPVKFRHLAGAHPSYDEVKRAERRKETGTRRNERTQGLA